MKIVLVEVTYQEFFRLYDVHHNFWLFYDLLRERGHSNEKLAGIGRCGGADDAARRWRLCPNLPMINEHCLTGIQNDSNSFTNDCVSLLHKHHLCFLGTSSSKLTGACLLHVRLEQAKPSPALPIHNGTKGFLKSCLNSYINHIMRWILNFILSIL